MKVDLEWTLFLRDGVLHDSVDNTRPRAGENRAREEKKSGRERRKGGRESSRRGGQGEPDREK